MAVVDAETIGRRDRGAVWPRLSINVKGPSASDSIKVDCRSQSCR